MKMRRYVQKHPVRNVRSRGLFSDAGKDYGNCTRTRRRQRAATSHAHGSVSWRHTFRALRHRNYRLFFWGQLVSLVGTWMQQTAMSWFVYQMTNSKLLLGVVAAVGSAPMMLSSIWGGSLADRHPKRSILVATQSGPNDLRVFACGRRVGRVRHHRRSLSSSLHSTASRWGSTCLRARRSQSKWRVAKIC